MFPAPVVSTTTTSVDASFSPIVVVAAWKATDALSASVIVTSFCVPPVTVATPALTVSVNGTDWLPSTSRSSVGLNVAARPAWCPRSRCSR